jgi:hypothetical protein
MTTTLTDLVKAMLAAKLQRDAAVLLRVTMASAVDTEGDLNPTVYDAAYNIAYNTEVAAHNPWKDARDALRQWGATNRADDATAEAELGEYAMELSDDNLSEVTCLTTEWRAGARH